MRRAGLRLCLSTLLRTSSRRGLGSTSILSDEGGQQAGERVAYLPYGGVRLGDASTLPTDYGFTGQRNEAGLGLMHYGARFYSPRLGRFVSADTLVPEPGEPQALNRYSYVYNRPLVLGDPSGHQPPEPHGQGRLPPPDALGFRLEVSVSPSAFIPKPVLYQAIADTAAIPDVGPAVAAALFIVTHTALDANIDVLLNANDPEAGQHNGFLYASSNWEEQLDISGAIGLQFIVEGGAFTAGPLYVWNLPENENLEGWGAALGGTFIHPAGLEGELFTSILPEGEPLPVGVYFPAFGLGGESSGYVCVNYTFDLTEEILSIMVEKGLIEERPVETN